MIKSFRRSFRRYLKEPRVRSAPAKKKRRGEAQALAGRNGESSSAIASSPNGRIRVFLRRIISRAVASELREGAGQSVPASSNGQAQAAVLPEGLDRAIYVCPELWLTDAIPIPR